MRDYSGNNRRYYPMRRVENRPGGAINLDKNNVNNLRMLASNKYGGRDIRLYQTNPTIFRKIGNRSGPKNLLNEFEFFNERKIYNTPIRQEANYHRKNYYSKGFDYINNSPINNELSLDKSYTTLRNFRRINPNQNNYRNYLQSYNYSPDYVIPNYRKTEYNSSYSKYNYNRNRISPRKSPNIITNRFWLNNYYGIKKIPAVVVTKKNDRRTSPYNTI